MSDFYGSSSSSSEPQSKREKFSEYEGTESNLEDFLDEELFLFSEDSDTETDSVSEEEAAMATEEPDPSVFDQLDNADRSTVPIEAKWIDDCPFKTKIPFTEITGLNHNLECITPFSFFNMFFPVSFIEFLVLETNAYAPHVLSQVSANRSRINEWKDTNVEEIRVFLGLLFLMGIIRINRMNNYWRKHPLFNLRFSKFMGRDRFLLILRCLHFDRERVSTDMLHKIRPLLTYFNDTMSQVYNPSRELTINESMVLFRGRLKFRQDVAHKRRNYGIKLYALAEPDGMIQKLYVFAGSTDKETGGIDRSTKIVRKLLEGREGKGHSIYMDNYYTSVFLVEDLLLKKTYCTGTLRTIRKGNPSAVTSAALKRGEVQYKYTKEGICCCKWKGKREVLCISSEYGGNMVKTKNKRGEIMYKPNLMVHYDKFVKTVDRRGQTLSYYPINHKSLRWYKKLGIHVMHVMLNNAYILYKKYSNNKINLQDFQLEIVMSLLPHPEEVNVIHHVSVHLPETLPKDKNNKTMRKRCKYCMETTKKRNDTIFCCPHCPGKPGLCLTPCFREFHGYS